MEFEKLKDIIAEDGSVAGSTPGSSGNRGLIFFGEHHSPLSRSIQGVSQVRQLVKTPCPPLGNRQAHELSWLVSLSLKHGRRVEKSIGAGKWGWSPPLQGYLPIKTRALDHLLSSLSFRGDPAVWRGKSWSKEMASGGCPGEEGSVLS